MTLRQIKRELEERYRMPGLLSGLASVLDLSGEFRNPIRRYDANVSDAELDALGLGAWLAWNGKDAGAISAIVGGLGALLWATWRGTRKNG